MNTEQDHTSNMYVYHGVPGTGVLETGLALSAAFCSSVISGSFFYKHTTALITPANEQCL